MSSPFTQSGRRLGFAVLLFVLGTILVVTLEPFQFRMPHRVRPLLWDGWFDVLANIALFIVPGFLYSLTRQATDGTEPPAERQRGTVKRAVVYGMLLSSTVELIQTFEPTRYPSPTDVLSNTTGAFVGAWLFFRISRFLRSDTPLIGMFALELPLMGLVYLLIPLCMLASLTLPHSGMSVRAYGLLALACFGGVLLGHVQRYRFGPGGLVRPFQTAGVAAGAFLLGTVPALPTNPVLVAVGASVAALVAWCIGALRISAASPVNRRFEATALRRGAGFFLCYLIVASLTLPRGSAVGLTKVQIIGQVESLAAFTVFGFMLAEGWGRLELRYRWVVSYVVVVCLAIAFATLQLQRVTSFTISDALMLATHSFAGAYGGWIYHLQRVHVRSLVAAQKARTAATTPTDAHRLSSAA